MRLFILSLLPFLLTACTQIKTGIANAPAHFDGLKTHTDIAYGTHGQTLDVYETNVKNAPVLLFIHGGRWQDGTKNMYRFIGSRFAQRGYVVVIPNYRKFPDVRYPAFAEEGADMVRWSIKNAGQYGGNPEKIFVMGHSSGAHTGVMIASHDAFGVSNKIAGFIGLSGPYDFTPRQDDIKKIFADVAPKNMQASTFIDGTEPPMLLIHGGQDTIVKISNLEKLKTAIQNKNGTVETIIYDDFNHVDSVSHMSWVYYDKNGIVNDIDQFIKRYSHAEND